MFCYAHTSIYHGGRISGSTLQLLCHPHGPDRYGSRKVPGGFGYPPAGSAGLPADKESRLVAGRDEFELGTEFLGPPRQTKALLPGTGFCVAYLTFKLTRRTPPSSRSEGSGSNRIMAARALSESRIGRRNGAPSSRLALTPGWFGAH